MKSMTNNNLRNSSDRRILVIALIVLVLAACAPHSISLLRSIAVDGPDAKWHYHWVRQFAEAMSEGVMYPRWAAYDHLGLGDPAFLYLHPGFYFFSAALSIGIGKVWSAMFWIAALSSLASAVLIFFCLRRHIGLPIALCCAMLAGLSPYGFHLSHYQQFLPMYCAMAALAAFLLTFTIPFSYQRLLLTAASMSVLVLSHVLVAFMAIVSTGPMLLLQAVREERGKWQSVLVHSLGVGLGLGIAGVYLYPAMTAQDLITPAAWFEPVFLDWRNSFIFQYFTIPDFGYKWFHLQWTIPAMSATLIIGSMLVAFIFRKDKSPEWWMCVDFCTLSLTAFLMGSEVSYALWESSETLQKLQFPYRMLTVATIASIIAFGFACSLLWKANHRFALGTALVLSIGASTALLIALQYRFVHEAVSTARVAQPSSKVSGLRVAMPVTATDESLQYLSSGGLQRECATMSLLCNQTLAGTHHRKWEIVSAVNTSNVRLPLLWFPGWQIRNNGRDLPPSWDAETGLVTVSVTPGKNEVEARWRGIPAERVGLGMSAVSLTLAVVVLGLARSRSGGRRQVTL